MLSDYDELPVHQAPYPVAEVPVSDLNWDNGYYWGVYSDSAEVFLLTGIRLTPNADMIGGYASIVHRGVQTTVRVSRILRPDLSVAVGPLRYDFDQPFRDLHLRLDDNPSGLSFDLHWLGLSDPFLEAHHLATRRGRRTTDQTRYTQGGTARGWIRFGDQHHQVTPDRWFADRDHSWGLYEPRRPLSDPREWLPPAPKPLLRRAFRLWVLFQGPDHNGFYQLHESEEGIQANLNDVFGSAFEGGIDRNWPSPEPRLAFTAGRHQLRFRPGTRIVTGGTVYLTDELGREWRQEIEVVGAPWSILPIGYYHGTWKDGGNLHTWHRSEPFHVEWDAFDVSTPRDHQTYDGRVFRNHCGSEYLGRIRTIGPGVDFTGLGHVEVQIEGRYTPYGFEWEPR